MTHEFGVFESCLWMALLTMDKKKISQNALTAFFRLIYKNQGLAMIFHYGIYIFKLNVYDQTDSLKNQPSVRKGFQSWILTVFTKNPLAHGNSPSRIKNYPTWDSNPQPLD